MVELVILVEATRVPTKVAVDKEDLVVARTIMLADPAVDEAIQMRLEVPVGEVIKEGVSDRLQLNQNWSQNQL